MVSKRETTLSSFQPTLFSEKCVVANFSHIESKYRHVLLNNRKEYREIENWRLLEDITLVIPHDIPLMQPCKEIPSRLEVFSEAIRKRNNTPLPNTWVHFYEYDKKFNCFWHYPERYLPKLQQYAGVIAPDFSLYENMPTVEKARATYKNYLLGAWMQNQGLSVIPNVRLSGRDSVSYALAGVPDNSVLALGIHGCIKNPELRRKTKEEIRIICEVKMPIGLVIYGTDSYDVLNFPKEEGIPIYLFPPDFRIRSHDRNIHE